MKRLFSFSFILLLLVAIAPVQAATYINEDMLHVESPISGDTYAAGGKVMFDEAVNGDLIVAGGDISINDRVDEDLMIAGGQIRVRGSVGDDIRIAGGEIEIGGNVRGDVIVFGGRVEILDGVTISGDLVVSGGDVTMNGTVLGKTTINAGTAYFGGATSGDVTVVAKNLTVDPSARIRGNVSYWTDTTMTETENIFGDTVTGTITFMDDAAPLSEREVHTGLAAALGIIFAASTVYSILATLLIIAIAILCTRTYFTDGVSYLASGVWLNAFYGLMYFIATPIIAALFLVTLIGIPVGAIILALYAITIALTKPLTAILLTKYWEQTKRPKKAKPLGNWHLIFLSLCVFVGMKVLSFVPIVGWLAVFFAICASYGALLRTEYAKFLKVR
ncbi:MAG: hypothetical protein KC680_03875 [Candidatus Peregrinibacteria bacterium]|nr:hypothetical protein [Candidatus Peregrinibacteria bacterium]MCB9808509.1 hypothetical protein [Candidatus Peribacteria bacterium]